MMVELTNKEAKRLEITLDKHNIGINQSMQILKKLKEYIDNTKCKSNAMYYREYIEAGSAVVTKSLDVYVQEDPNELTLKDVKNMENILYTDNELITAELEYCLYDDAIGDYDVTTIYLNEDTPEDWDCYERLVECSVDIRTFDEDNLPGEAILEIGPSKVGKLTKAEVDRYNELVTSYLRQIWDIKTIINEELDELSFETMMTDIAKSIAQIEVNKTFDEFIADADIELDNYILDYQEGELKLVREFVGRRFNWNSLHATNITNSIPIDFRYTITDLSWRNSRICPSGYSETYMNNSKHDINGIVMRDRLSALELANVLGFKLLINRGSVKKIKYKEGGGQWIGYDEDSKVCAWILLEHTDWDRLSEAAEEIKDLIEELQAYFDK